MSLWIFIPMLWIIAGLINLVISHTAYKLNVFKDGKVDNKESLFFVIVFGLFGFLIMMICLLEDKEEMPFVNYEIEI